MSITRIRLDRAIAQATERLLKRGDPPTFDDLRNALREETGADRPIMDYVRQTPKQLLDVGAHNRMLWQANQDFEVLFKEFYIQAQRSLQTLDRGDGALRRILQEGKIANDLLEHELIRVKDATGFFLGNFDTFRDASKIDLSLTTATVDLGTESVRLFRNRGGTRRHRLEHMRLPVNQAEILIRGAGTHVIQSRNLPGQAVGNLFDSLTTAWQYEVTSTKSDGIEVELTFPLTPDGTGVPVTSVVVDPISIGSVPAQVFVSPDGQNFLRFDVGTPKHMDGAKVRFSGALETTRRLRMLFRIPTPSRSESVEGAAASVYFLSIREIEVYKEAFQETGVLVSRVLNPISEPAVTTVDKVSLDVEEEVPPGTRIDYEIAASTTPTDFRAISPINRPQADHPRVIDFDRITEVPARTNVQDVSSTALHTFSDGSTKRNGMSFYEIYTFPDAPQFLATTVRRGLDAWQISSREGSRRVLTERGNLLSFSATGNSASLHVNVFDERIQTHPASVTGTDTIISPRFPMITDPDCIPAASGQDLQNPCAILGRIILHPSTETRTSPTLAFTNGQDVVVRVGTAVEGFEGEKLLVFPKGTGFPTRRVNQQTIHLTYNDSSGSSISGDFRVKQVVSNGAVDTLVLDDPRDVLHDSGSGNTLAGRFLSLDVAGDVVSTSDKDITLTQALEIKKGDVFVVDYRRPLLGTERLLTSSVQVTSSVDDATAFVLDRDFSIDASGKTITRSPNGNIPVSSEGTRSTVRAAFSYERRDLSRYTYKTTVTTPQGPNTVIDIDSSTFSLGEGESAQLVTPNGPVDLSTVTSLELPPGRHVVTVVSIPARRQAGVIAQGTAFYKVVNLKDREGNYVFAQGKYFDQQEAFGRDMQEVSFFRLQASVPRDNHDFFAITSSKLIFNFDPLSDTSDVVMLLPGTTTALARERIAIGYRFRPTTEVSIPGVILRATLKRLAGAEDSVSPTLHSYSLRMLHGN